MNYLVSPYYPESGGTVIDWWDENWNETLDEELEDDQDDDLDNDSHDDDLPF
jgi:hypothetical protein